MNRGRQRDMDRSGQRDRSRHRGMNSGRHSDLDRGRQSTVHEQWPTEGGGRQTEGHGLGQREGHMSRQRVIEKAERGHEQ
jgi:hypothetical protein